MSGEDQFKQFTRHLGAQIGTTAPGISLNEVREFINQSYYFDSNPTVGPNGFSIGDLFTVASNANMNLYDAGFDFIEPHKMFEFIGLNYLNNDAPTISLNGSSSVSLQGGWDHLLDVLEYNPALAYSANETVRYFGTIYLALQAQAANANKFPNTSPTYWQALARPFYYGFAFFDIQLLSGGSWQSMNNTLFALCDSASTAQVLAQLLGVSINAGSTIIGPGIPNGSNPSFWSKNGNDLRLHFNQTWSPAGGVFAGAHVEVIPNYFTRSNTNFISNTFRWPGSLANFDSRIVEDPVNQTNCQWLYMVNDVGCGERIYYYEPGSTASDREEGNITNKIHGKVYQYNYQTSNWDEIDSWGWDIYNNYVDSFTGYSPGRFIPGITGFEKGAFAIQYTIQDYWGEQLSVILNINVT